MTKQRFVLLIRSSSYDRNFSVAGIGTSKTEALKNARNNFGRRIEGEKKYVLANPKVEDKHFTRFQTGYVRKGVFTPHNYLQAKRDEREHRRKMVKFNNAVDGNIDSFLSLDINNKLLVLFKKIELLENKKEKCCGIKIKPNVKE
jgi:hypothetical protein